MLVWGINISNAQLLPNGSFESWYMHPLFDVEEPEEWVTSNIAGASVGLEANVTKTNDAHDGNHAIRLETILDADNEAFIGAAILNAEISGKPTKCSGYYKGNFVNGDEPGIGVIVKSGVFPVGGADYLFTESQGSYTYFEFTLEYFLEMPPDSVLVTIFSDFEDEGNQGTVLLLDDLSLTISSGIEPLFEEVAIRLSPNPARDQMQVSVPMDAGMTNFTIISAEGQYLANYNLQGEQTIYFNLPTGLYYYELRNQQNQVINVGRFMVVK